MATIDVQQIVKNFGAQRAVDGVTFTVDCGEIFGLVGPNGAGKTTTIRILLDIFKPDSGKVAILGGPMDMAPMILIMTPILLPVVMQFGMDPVHFGLILILNSGMGLLTPPVGTVLFVGCAIGKVSVQEGTKAMWPFFCAMIVVLMLITYVPQISLWLPSMFK